MENSGAFKQPLFLDEGSGKLFTKEELAELEMFDREVDNEDQLRGNAQKREWKKIHPRDTRKGQTGKPGILPEKS